MPVHDLKHPVAEARPIVFETPNLLELPKICVCCGQKTKRTLAVKPSDPSKLKQELAMHALGLVFHPVHVAWGLKVLLTPNAKIPLCGKCRFKYFLPDKKLLGVIGLLVVFFVGAFYWGLHAEYGWMFLCLLLAIASLIFIVRKNVRHERNTLPVRVYQFNGKYRYVIFGGPLYQLAVKEQSAPPEEIR